MTINNNKIVTGSSNTNIKNNSIPNKEIKLEKIKEKEYDQIEKKKDNSLMVCKSILMNIKKNNKNNFKNLKDSNLVDKQKKENIENVNKTIIKNIEPGKEEIDINEYIKLKSSDTVSGTTFDYDQEIFFQSIEKIENNINNENNNNNINQINNNENNAEQNKELKKNEEIFLKNRSIIKNFIKNNKNIFLKKGIIDKKNKNEIKLKHMNDELLKIKKENDLNEILKVLNDRFRLLTKNNNISLQNFFITTNEKNEHENINEDEKILLLLTRDYRVNDNWALIYAYEIAKKQKKKLISCTYLFTNEKYSSRYLDIKIKVLKNLEINLKKLNIPFYLLNILIMDEIMQFVKLNNIKIIITDFHTLKNKKNSLQELIQLCNSKLIKIIQVDSHNTIPVWITSNLLEKSSRTIKLKIDKYLKKFLTEYIKLEPFDQNISFPETFNVEKVIKKFKTYPSPAAVNFIYTEEKSIEILQEFLTNYLHKYNENKYDMEGDIITKLSPFINFGLISSQRCILEVNKYTIKHPSIKNTCGKTAFLDEILIQKELSENFCYYNKNYDNMNGLQQWISKMNVEKFKFNKYVYEYDELKYAKTHDALWNCCQLHLVNEGLLYGVLKYYWANHILYLTRNLEEGVKYATNLFNEFSLCIENTNSYVSLLSAMIPIHEKKWNNKHVLSEHLYLKNSEKYNNSINNFMNQYPDGIEVAYIIKKIPINTFADYLSRKRKRDDDDDVKNLFNN